MTERNCTFLTTDSEFVDTLLCLSDNFYVYCQFWNQSNSDNKGNFSNSAVSVTFTILLLFMLVTPLLKLVISFIWYGIIKFFFLITMYVLSFFCCKNSSYYTNPRIYKSTYPRILKRNFYKSLNYTTRMSFIPVIFYLIFLLINLIFFILFLNTIFSSGKVPSSIQQADTELIVFKMLATYTHFTVEVYILFYILIDDEVVKSTSVVENLTLNSNNEIETYKSKYNLRGLTKKMIYSLICTLTLFCIILLLSFLLYLWPKESTSILFFYVFKLLCISKELFFFYLYPKCIYKLMSYSRYKNYWRMFIETKNLSSNKSNHSYDLSSQSINPALFKKNYSFRKTTLASNNTINRNLSINHSNYNKLRSTYDSEMHGTNYDKLTINDINHCKVSIEAQTLGEIESSYLNNLLKNKKTSYLMNYECENKATSSTILPTLNYVHLNNNSKVDVVYNTKCKYQHKYKYVFTLSLNVFLYFLLFLYTMVTFISGKNFSILTSNLSTFMIIRIIMLIQSLTTFFNAWLLFNKCELREVWLTV